jgi:hypothetical protein
MEHSTVTVQPIVDTAVRVHDDFEIVITACDEFGNHHTDAAQLQIQVSTQLIATQDDLPSPAEYLGCFSNLLAHENFVPIQTAEGLARPRECAAACVGFLYAAVGHQGICFCGDQMSTIVRAENSPCIANQEAAAAIEFDFKGCQAKGIADGACTEQCQRYLGHFQQCYGTVRNGAHIHLDLHPRETASNVALRKNTSASSSAWGGSPVRGVDGNSAGVWGAGSCTHTQNGMAEWWQVDLGDIHSVGEFHIFHRTDCCQDRLNLATVVIGDTADYTTGTHCYGIGQAGATDTRFDELTGQSTVAPERGSCDGLTGQYLTISTNGRYLAVCEFEAYGVLVSSLPRGIPTWCWLTSDERACDDVCSTVSEPCDSYWGQWTDSKRAQQLALLAFKVYRRQPAARRTSAFTILPASYSFFEGEEACKRIGGHLASVHSQSDINAVMETGWVWGQESERALWIGLNQLGGRELRNRLGFRWTDGTPVDFGVDRWRFEHPRDRYCAAMRADGRYEDRPCVEKADVLCRVDNFLAAANAAGPPTVLLSLFGIFMGESVIADC